MTDRLNNLSREYGSGNPKPLRVNASVRALAWDKTKGRCWYCGRQTNPWRDFCIDHVVNGLETLDNLVPACRRCNHLKNNQTLDDFRPLFSRDTGQPRFYFEEVADGIR
jgi:5-methylcytosine-specific restriction endonuclease McrA